MQGLAIDLTMMWQNILTWLAQQAWSRYVRMIDEQVARLRVEHGVNFLFEPKGFPPIPTLR
jgi:hypothetical protein